MDQRTYSKEHVSVAVDESTLRRLVEAHERLSRAGCALEIAVDGTPATKTPARALTPGWSIALMVEGGAQWPRRA